MMGTVEVTAFSTALPTAVYDVLDGSGVLAGFRVVGAVPAERVDVRRTSDGFIADYFGRIDLIGLSDGGTLIRWRVVFRARSSGTRWMLRLGLVRSTSALARRLARFAEARDYDAPPY